MSAYITLATPMTDRDSLLAALSDVGFGHDKVEVHAAPVPLVDYGGGVQMHANIVVRSQHIGSYGSDIGFLASPTGYRVMVRGYLQGAYGEAWLRRLHAGYQHHWATKQAHLAEAERQRVEDERQRLVEAQRSAVLERAKKMGYQVKESREGSSIRIMLVKRSY